MVVIETLVFCDYCGENHGGDNREQTAATIRKERRQWGWVQHGSKDFCSKGCQEEYNKSMHATGEDAA